MGMKSRQLAATASLILLAAFSAPADAKNILNQILGNSGVRTGNNQVFQVELSNFATRQSQLRSQIQSMLSSGQISWAAAQNLTAQLDQLAAQTQQQASLGAFAPGQSQAIVAAFGSITDQLNASATTGTINNNLGYGMYNRYDYNNGYYNPYLQNGRYLGGLGRYLGY